MQRITKARILSRIVGLQLGLIMGVFGSAVSGVAQPTNDNFADAAVIEGVWGSIAADNTDATSETGEPNHAGYAAGSSIWYTWTAPQDGEVTFDTLGSIATDTVLAVYTGANLSTLTQVSANDDLFPVGNDKQMNYFSSADYAILSSKGGMPLFSGYSPYYGPSGLRFNAKGGTTYRIALTTKSAVIGTIQLNWAYKPSGVFRFAAEDFDLFLDPVTEKPLPVYQCAQTESRIPIANNLDRNSVVLTYYRYNAPGVLVTVTRVGGATGRAKVDYTTVDGTQLPMLPITDVPAVAGTDYVPVSGTLIFDDFEMSKTILIPIIYNYLGGSGGETNNTAFGVVLSNAQPDPFEASDVSQPKVDPEFSTAIVKILNVNADPYGPNMAEVVSPDPVDPTLSVTNMVQVSPTNAIFNFQKANYRVPADVNTGSNGWTEVALYVSRYGTNTSSATLNYRVNNWLADDTDGDEQKNIYFPLQPGSDYAVPTPENWPPIRGINADFVMEKGTISFGDNDFYSKKISFTVPNSSLTKFNKDFRVQLYQTQKIGNRDVPVLMGMVSETTVTILFDDQKPPAGSVDQLHNADFNSTLALPPNDIPQTFPNNNNSFPGVAGQVYGLVVLTNDQTVIVGDFVSYNGYPLSSIALINPDGSPDISFDTGTGANAAINAIAVTPAGQFVIGGIFTSFNGSGSSGVARLNRDGSIDNSFMPVVNGPVRSILVQPDGKVVIGGDFTQVDGMTRKYIARLNTDGSLDASFDSGDSFDGSVYALAIPKPFTISAGGQADGGSNEVVQVINFAPATTGTLTVTYDMLSVPDRMRVFYGDTNGPVIFDTGNVSGSQTVDIPFGPINGVTTNFVTIVMNQGGGDVGTYWGYEATVSILPSLSEGIAVGGQFNVAGKAYKNIAMLDSTDGSLSASFNPGTGPDDKVMALGWQLDGKIVAGGSFTHVNGNSYNHIVRLNQNGSIDSANFFVGTGADNVVYSISLQLDGTIYVGGAFSSFNGTHRYGFARLYPNGMLDTTFLDTAYNQFAGLKRIYSWDTPAVFTSGVQSDGNVLIGGAFQQVGGGQANTNICNVLDSQFGYELSFADTNLWVEPKTRDGVRNRSGFARLIGGATPGPGNIGLKLENYSANKSQSLISVSLLRTNGILGPVSANFSVQPGLALSGKDYVYNSAPPTYWTAWEYLSHPSRVHADGLSGVSGFLVDPYGLSLGNSDLLENNLSAVTVSIIKNTATAGNLNAQFQLMNPSYMDHFYLGGQNIPVGAALGVVSAPFTLVDDTQQPGVFGFSSPVYIATNATAIISVLRSNGVFGNVSMQYSTSNGTAVAGSDYVGLTNKLLLFNQNVVSNGFGVTVRNNGFIYTNSMEKTVNLSLASLGITPGATFGISNAVLRLINPNYQGYVTLSSTNFSGVQSAGTISFVVNRVAGSLGSISLQYATVNGTALSGVDYIGSTNTLNWNSGDVAPKTVILPLLNSGMVGGNKQFAVSLFNSKLNGTNTPTLMGSITNAVLTIINDNSYGTVQFSAPTYNVNEAGGYATITVIRSGGAAGGASVNYAVDPGTNTVSGVNFTPTSGVLMFGSNQISASFNVPVLNDNAVNPSDFNFKVSLVNPTNVALGSLTVAYVNILDANSYIRPPGAPDTQFDPNTSLNGNVFALALQSDGRILAGGDYTAIGTSLRSRIARLNTDGSLDSTFLNSLAGANGPVLSLINQSDDRVLVGGSFTSINGVFRNNIARLMTDGTLDTSFNPGSGADNIVNALAETFVAGARKIYVGGLFGSVGGASSSGLVRLKNDGSLDTSFSVGAGADGGVYAIAPYPTNSIYAGKVLVGGTFTHFNGVAANRLVRLNADGTVDSSFNSNLGFGANGPVYAIALQPDGRALVGGGFTNFNNTVLNRIVRLNTDGTLDSAFAAQTGSGFNGTVKNFALQADNRILVVGQFTQANGVTRNRITRLLPTGATDPTINFGAGANEDVNSVVVQPSDNMLVIAGGFTEYDGMPHERIARIYGGSVTGSGAFSFTTPNFQASEIGGFAFVTVRRVGGTSGNNPDGSGNITVDFVTSDGTAAAGVNYGAVFNTLTFPPGEVLKTIAVPVIDDFVVTPDLTVNLALANPLPPSGFGDQSTAVLTIVNSDTSVSLSASTYSVMKNTPNGGAEITIVRQGGSGGSCSVDFATTGAGTAVPGFDYTPTNGTVVFGPGETVKTVKIPVINNGVPEGNTTVSIVLTNPVGTFMASPSNATLTIIDTVVAPGTLSFGASAYATTENNSSVQVTVVRTAGSSGAVSVNYSTVSGTALPGINYQSSSNMLNFADGQTSKTFTVDLVDNALVQGPVSFSIVLSAPQSGATLGTPASTTITIADNDVALSVIPSGVALLAESNPNGMIDTNESVTISFGLRVSAGTNIQNLVATLLPTNGIVSPSPASQNYGNLMVRGPSASRSFSFNVNPACTNGQQISATFQLQMGSANLGVVQFDFVLGTSTKVFSNTNVIVMSSNGVAAPYPSTINVSGVGGYLTKATLSLNKFNHTFPQDVDAVVQAPSHQSVLFLNNAGSSVSANNLNLTFDDAASAMLPQGALASGTYKPSVYPAITVFPSPAPSGPYATNLATFNGGNPNGTWSLFVIDDSPLNTGAISNGWSLALSTISLIGSAADVGVSTVASASSATIGASFSFVVAVTNYGPSASSGVSVTNILPSGFSFVSATPSQGTATANNGTVIWTVGSLPLDAGAKLTIVGSMPSLGAATNSVLVASATNDPNPADNSASAVIAVTTAQPPQLTGSFLAGTGSFQLSVAGAAVPTVVQASTNLVNWVPVYTNTPPFDFSDPNTGARPYRFYRAVLAQ